jgi:hypothetical protein
LLTARIDQNVGLYRSFSELGFIQGLLRAGGYTGVVQSRGLYGGCLEQLFIKGLLRVGVDTGVA